MLYDQIDLTKAWNDPSNAAALAARPSLYGCLALRWSPPDHTSYLAVVGPDACFHPTEPRPLAEFGDGPENTLMLIDAPVNRSVPWMQPLDADENLLLEVSPRTCLSHFGGLYALRANGDEVVFRIESTPKERKAMLTIAGDDNADLRDR